jgi:nicotinamidase-related amidase
LPIEHCKYCSEGWQIISELPTNQAKIIDKTTFGDVYLAQELAEFYNINTDPNAYIEFCGVCTDICVVSNALLCRAYMPNIRIIVDANCCAGTTPKKHRAALEVMKSCQIEVVN